MSAAQDEAIRELEKVILEMDGEIDELKDQVTEFKGMYDEAWERVGLLEVALETVKADAIYTIDRAL